MKQRIKQWAMLIPVARRYLAEKHTLAENWARTITERDQYRIALEQQTTERDQYRIALEQRTTERDQYRIALEQRTTERDQYRIALEQRTTERDVLSAERDSLVQERNKLVTEAAQHRIEMEKTVGQRDWLLQERAQHQDRVLGKLATVQSQIGTLQRNIARAVETPHDKVSQVLTRSLYLDLLEDSLIGAFMRDESIAPHQRGYDENRRELGRDWPKFACTMIGKARMRNIRELCETILDGDVPGDFLEAGVWRGGACIYMRGILKAYGIPDRTVWVADSFAGLPPPNPEQYPADRDDPHHTFLPLIIPLEEVRDNFAKYGLLDDQVQFLKGWFKDTLPNAPIKRLAVLRLDGDMYESTIQSLDALYWKVSPDGFIIIDDYILPACRKAVDDFRAQHDITAKLEPVDGAAVYWCKAGDEKNADRDRVQRSSRKREKSSAG
ncbi:MAG: TylF/MycF/NovP-related O-methyltransferase [Xanthobacteraceae bacterium]|jgi:O-methyltransferase/8-demethyl-8-(2,3-dimethoxy-alpha-L-rhamnosyl)tetracenomycin-C 4'-O-methyltransferase